MFEPKLLGSRASPSSFLLAYLLQQHDDNDDEQESLLCETNKSRSQINNLLLGDKVRLLFCSSANKSKRVNTWSLT